MIPKTAVLADTNSTLSLSIRLYLILRYFFKDLQNLRSSNFLKVYLMTDRKWTLPCLTNYLLAQGTFCALVNSCIIRCIPASPLSVGLCWNRPKRCALNMNPRFQHLAAPPDWSRSNPLNTLKLNQNLPPPSSHKKYVEQSFINGTDNFSYPIEKSSLGDHHQMYHSDILARRIPAVLLRAILPARRVCRDARVRRYVQRRWQKTFDFARWYHLAYCRAAEPVQQCSSWEIRRGFRKGLVKIDLHFNPPSRPDLGCQNHVIRTLWIGLLDKVRCCGVKL